MADKVLQFDIITQDNPETFPNFKCTVKAVPPVVKPLQIVPLKAECIK